MAHETNWSPPNTGEFFAAYQYGNGALVPVTGQTHSQTHEQQAQQTWDAFATAHRFPDAAVMILKSDAGVSLGALNGGVIIEGRNKMNIGLLMASTRRLLPVKITTGLAKSISSQDRFRRAFWAVLTRIEAAVLPRVMTFNLAGVIGSIQIENGKLTFSGDFLNPADFVGELRAACAIEDDVKFTLGAFDASAKGPTFTISDLLEEVVGATGEDTFEFDADGWPLTIAEGTTFATVQHLSNLANTLGQRDEGSGTATLTVLSSANTPIVSGKLTENGSVRFSVVS